MTLLLALALLSLAVWIYLIAFHGRFWRADQVLGESDDAPTLWPEVVAIIPARDEAQTIAASLKSHMGSTYPGRFSVILVDDHSTDGTAERARAAANAERLTIASAPDLAPGWTGKLWAQRYGVEIARKNYNSAKYYFFTDADITHEPNVLSRLVAKAEAENLALVSLMAKLDSRGLWGGLLVPAFIFFFQKLYPFARVNDPTDPTAGAAGGCMLVRRDALEAAGGLPSIREALIDDCSLAALIKGQPPQRKIWLGLTEDVHSARDNRKLSSIWHMVARTAYAQLNHNPLLLAGTLAGMGLVYLAAPLIVLSAPLHGETPATVAAILTYLLMVKSYGPTRRLYGEPAIAGLFLPVAALLYTLMTLSSAIRHWRGQGGQWKGRTYPTPGASRGEDDSPNLH